MSIYISGLNLPPKGEFTDVRIFSDGWAHKATAEPPLYNRAYEAINVNPHGRLIDADALRRQWIEAESENGGNMRLDELTLHDIITEGCVFDLDNAPTIIPADKEETA